MESGPQLLGHTQLKRYEAGDNGYYEQFFSRTTILDMHCQFPTVALVVTSLT
jgi:hypothetical protein